MMMFDLKVTSVEHIFIMGSPAERRIHLDFLFIHEKDLEKWTEYWGTAGMGIGPIFSYSNQMEVAEDYRKKLLQRELPPYVASFEEEMATNETIEDSEEEE